ncbi:uncharacterized protein BDR25DRAFT_295297 [Lindgomyces ingoldianus]|uniref:Uncharacterized protein n=1 Tax=Lindgomyces ingoldianus TaxID=673940 RepID=A0ACB6QFE2_9PLEO|nr:uncharacterized protein BDR25DRAFT_295297 [Lindgomyces ingoldianus]KAF2465639.1 hypothetical protein BDR25DRAFT_295297 [Lindgomyces ingoldianus]
MNGRSGEVLAVAVLFFILTWATVALRVYTRYFLTRTFGKDDWSMVATIALIFWYLCELLYVLSNCTLKIALGIFYLRVAVQRWHTWVIKLLMTGTVFFGGCYFFMAAFQCIPVSEFWNNHPASSRCIPKAPTTGITYALSAVNAFADWSLGILPFFIVLDLQMNLKTKFMVAGILAFAAIGSTGTIVRMKYIHSLTNGQDFLWANTDVAIWSTVEPGIGITAASMATLKPLLQTCLWRIGPTEAPSSARLRPSNRSSPMGQNQKHCSRIWYHRSLGLDDLRLVKGSTLATTTGPQKPEKMWQGSRMRTEAVDEGEEMGGTGTGTGMGRGINKRVTVEYSCEGLPRLELSDFLERDGLSIS